MAAVRVTGKELSLISQENIINFSIGETTKTIYQSEKPTLPNPEEKKQLQGNEKGSTQVLACGFSPAGHYFVSCDNYKQITTWQVSSGSSWKKLGTRPLARRAMALTFSQDEQTVLVGDKSGDVYSYSLVCPDKNGELLMGHVSMLLDLVLCHSDRYLATCDRDEKVRISHFPNAHSIQAFCLGHTDYVSRVVYFKQGDFLVSGSGDGSLRLWNPETGKQIHCTQCQAHLEQELADMKTESQPDKVKEDSGSDQQEKANSGEEKEWKIARLKPRVYDGLDLKCLVCCQQQRLLAVGFERLSVVLLYKLSSSNDGTILTFLHKLPLNGHLWDMTFNLQGHLLVLQSCESSPLLVFDTSSSDKKISQLETANDTLNILATVNAANDHWELLKGSVGQETIFPVLHKVQVDNAEFYQQQKRVKMEQQKQKFKEKQGRRNYAKKVLPSGECKKNNANDKPTMLPSGECEMIKDDTVDQEGVSSDESVDETAVAIPI